MDKKRILAGIQPSGILHIGNYFASIKQLIQEQDKNEVFAFIANYHALTTITDNEQLKTLTLNSAIDFLALGLNPNKCNFWVQSDVKEVLELYWIISSYTPMGLLQRAHSYKDKVANGINANHSLFSYPVLMASDILLFDSQIIPVGKDQIQHIEIARDIAVKFNASHGDIFTLPEPKVDDNVATILGIDGRKMSKSYANTINIFSDLKELKKSTNKIITDSTPLEEPKEFKNCNVYNIAKHFLNDDEKIQLQERYNSGKEGYGHFKAYLKDTIYNYFAIHREKREYYENNINEVKDILNDGAKKVSKIAKNKIDIIQDTIGLKY